MSQATPPPGEPRGGNFGFLDGVDHRLARIGRQAEGYVHTDPESCLFKLRLMVETMAGTLTKLSIAPPATPDLGVMLGMLEREGVLPRHFADHMHAIRRDGNAAVHGNAAPASTAMRRLRDAFTLARWYFTQVRRGSRMPEAQFQTPAQPAGPLAAAGPVAEALEDSIESQRRRTRDALLLFRDREDAEAVTSRLLAELEAIDMIAAAAGEPLLDAETVALIMAMELEQLLEHPTFGRSTRDARREAEEQLTAVKRRLDEQEVTYRRQREELAE